MRSVSHCLREIDTNSHTHSDELHTAGWWEALQNHCSLIVMLDQPLRWPGMEHDWVQRCFDLCHLAVFCVHSSLSGASTFSWVSLTTVITGNYHQPAAAAELQPLSSGGNLRIFWYLTKWELLLLATLDCSYLRHGFLKPWYVYYWWHLGSL